MFPRAPISARPATLFPSTSPFRSAARIHLHVRRASALCDPRTADGRVEGADGRDWRQAGLRLFGGAVRLCVELQPRDAAVDAAAGRGGLCPALLWPVPLLHPPLRPDDAEIGRAHV